MRTVWVGAVTRGSLHVSIVTKLLKVLRTVSTSNAFQVNNEVSLFLKHAYFFAEEQKYWGPFGRAHRAEERSESEQQFPSTALAATPEHASVAAENARVDAAHVTTTILQLDWESSIKDCLLRYGKNKTLHWKRLRDLVIEAVKKKYRKQQGKLSLEDNTYRAILEDCCLSKVNRLAFDIVRSFFLCSCCILYS